MSDEDARSTDAFEKRFTRREVVKGAVVAGAAVSLGSLLTACGGSSSSSSPAASASAVGSPKMGGELRAGLIGGSSSNTIDPTYEITESDAAREVMCYEALNLIRADGTIEMLLAESMTPNKDATEWIIKLKPGITWHNGKDFTADDVAYTYNYIYKNKKNGANFLSLVDLPAMKVMDKVLKRQKVDYFTYMETPIIDASNADKYLPIVTEIWGTK